MLLYFLAFRMMTVTMNSRKGIKSWQYPISKIKTALFRIRKSGAE